MVRWILLLLVMELAALAMYAPSLGDLTPESALYPEKLLRVDYVEGEYVEHRLDRNRDLRSAVGVASYGVMTACWLVALYWLSRSNGRMDRRTLVAVLIGAGVVAVTLWGLPPTFSNDSYRYRLEGASTITGYNPYEFKPDSAYLVRKNYPELFWSTDFRYRPTIYGPFAEFTFAVNALLGNTMLGLRAILLGAAGLLVYGCLAILRWRGAGAGWVLAVALCPLVIVETSLDGHMEMIPVALMVAGIVTLDRRQWATAAVLLALAVNTKYLWPALAAFLLLGRLARQKKLLAGSGVFVLTAVVCWLPFMLLSWSSLHAMGATEDWSAWMPLPLRLTLEAPRQFLEYPNFNATVYRVLGGWFHPAANLPKLLSLAVVLAGLAALIWRRRWWMDIEDIVLLLAVALILSPVSYTWYFLWLVPGLLVLGRGELWRRTGPPVWIVFYLAMVPALHEHLMGLFRFRDADPFPPLPWMIVAAVAPLLAAAWVRRLRRPIFAQ